MRRKLLTTEDIENLVAHGESKTIEFKKSTAQLRAACETLCAFLNGQGGTVLFGVTDNGKIVGQEVSDNTKREIAKELAKIEPTAEFDICYVSFKGNNEVIILTAEKGNHAPYVYDGRAFQRNQSATEKMSQHRYEQLLVERGQLNYSWEDAFAQEYTLTDLDQEEIYRTVTDGIARKIIPPSIAKEKPEKILRQLNLLVDKKLKRAAVVLFAKEIKSGYQQCWLKMARFRGTSKSNDFIDNQQIHCNVFRMLEEVDNFLSRHLPMASYFKPDQWQRIDKPILPALAVREALVNAICHRNYADRSGYISVAIFDDCLEIWNNGTLPEKLTIRDLKRKHDSILRNKLIANVFYLRGYIETWGTGTITMADLCKENGIPELKFKERTGGLAVTFRFTEPIGGSVSSKKIELTDRQKEIIKLLETAQLNSAQITEKLKSSKSRRMVQLDLTKLEKAGLIKREGESRSITWRLIK